MKIGRRWWLGAVILAALILVTVFAAPRSSSLSQGSTYSRAPSGYGAWYAYMQQQGVQIRRWQKPIDQLVQSHRSKQQAAPSPLTLIQIDNGTGFLGAIDSDWVKQGSTLVLIGVRAAVSDAPFSSSLSSPAGAVQIETSRRESRTARLQPLLSDDYGAVVWSEPLGEGKIIYAATPYLAANAYQDQPGNFKFLAQLVTQAQQPIWVDEYMHGYKDAETIAQENSQNLLSYLAKTPLLLLAVQSIFILLVLVWGQNQRLGAPLVLQPPKVDNSESYIRALAAVLYKANCSGFVLETLRRAEQLHIQAMLGLGTEAASPEAVADAWHQQTGQPAAVLTELLNPQLPQRPSERELLVWLRNAQTVRQTLSSKRA